MRSDSTIRRWKRELRKLIDGSADPAITRVAYAMETILTVALSESRDYIGYNPATEAIEAAKLLHLELGR